MSTQNASPTIAYFDCFSGASGDMLLSALLDAGLALADLQADVAKLGLKGVSLEIAPCLSHGISGSQFSVVDESQDRPARNLDSVVRILQASQLPEDVIEESLRVFSRIAHAEAGIHGTTIDQVHFHELGAVDTLVDIVGFCSSVRRLGIQDIYASPLPLGSGTIQTEHGRLPVPAPATLALIADAGAPTTASPARTELVTPTGAGILTTLATFERVPMRVRRVGYGFGRKELPWANMLRVWIGEREGASAVHDHEHAHDHVHDPTHHHAHGHVHEPGPEKPDTHHSHD